MLQLDLSGSRLINSNLKLLGKQINKRLGIEFNGIQTCARPCLPYFPQKNQYGKKVRQITYQSENIHCRLITPDMGRKSAECSSLSVLPILRNDYRTSIAKRAQVRHVGTDRHLKCAHNPRLVANYQFLCALLQKCLLLIEFMFANRRKRW